MTLSSHVEWAIHCCTVLAGFEAGERVSTVKLAEFHGVPKEYLSKALQSLARAGLVEGSLGPTGGYRLSRPSKSITLLQVVEAIEGREPSFVCQEIRGNNPCLKKSEKPTGVCAVARAMYRADEAWRRELRSVTIDDLVKTVTRDVAGEILERGRDYLLKR